MRVEVNLCICKGCSQFSHTVGRTPPSQLMGKKLGVVVGGFHMQEESISINGMPYR